MMVTEEDSNALPEIEAPARNANSSISVAGNAVDDVAGDVVEVTGLCDENKSGCEHICDDSSGSVSCLCYRGYVLADDGITCNGKSVYSFLMETFLSTCYYQLITQFSSSIIFKVANQMNFITFF